MISVSQADAILRDLEPATPCCRVPLAACNGRILAEDIYSDRQLPAAAIVRMDGIALRANDGPGPLPVAGTVAAGQPQQLLAPGTCLEVMTGAVLPNGADCVVPVENIRIVDRTACIQEPFAAGDYFHPAGADFASGALLMQRGLRLRTPQLAALASVGATNVLVAAPKLTVLGTGDELIQIERDPLPHQLRQSNGPALAAAASRAGFPDVHYQHVLDDQRLLAEAIATALAQSDLLVLSGGVSKGKFDYIPGLLQQAGVSKLFHGVQQRPGKPMWCGWSEQHNTLVFGLPGNPVSAIVGFRRYVQRTLLRAYGSLDHCPSLALADEVSFPPALTCFKPVRLVAGQAEPVPLSNSGDWAGLAQSDGFLELAQDCSTFAAGSSHPYYPW